MSKRDSRILRILFVGPQSVGSNSLSLANAFRKLGHFVQAVDEDYYEIRLGKNIFGRCLNRLTRPMRSRALGEQVLLQSKILKPDLLVVFKGFLMAPSYLRELKRQGVYLINFYPDVSMIGHSVLIPKCLPLYDHIFTTKSFGIRDMKNRVQIKSIEYLPHGFDPDLEYPHRISHEIKNNLGSDVSFIGTWSTKKATYLECVAKSLPDIQLRIWGAQWEKAQSPLLKSKIVGHEVFGDFYSMAIQCSKISIAILSEIRPGASSGDLTTSRTFEIPAIGGFMLHERTDELLKYYKEGKEVACFSSPSELAEKCNYYLNHEQERNKMKEAGTQRCLKENSIVVRAEKIIEHFIRVCEKE